MKRPYIPFLLTTACLLVFTTACSDAGNDEEEQSEKTPLQLNFSMTAGNTVKKDSRNILNGTSMTESVGVYLSKSSDNSVYPGGTENGKYIYTPDGGSWNSNEPVYLYSETAKIHAFHPATAAVTPSSTGNHTLPADIPATQHFNGDSETETDIPDYLYGLSGNTPASGLVTADNKGSSSATPVEKKIYMHHALCQVVFKLQYAQSRLPDASNDYIKSISLKSNAFRAGTGTMQINNGIFSLSAPGAATLYFQANSHTEQQPGATDHPVTVAYGLTAPCHEPEDNVTLSVTLGAQDNTHNDRTFSVTSSEFKVKWKAGKTYIYHLTLDNVGIGVQSATTIDGWDTRNENTDVPPEGFALKLKAEIDGNAPSRAAASGSAAYDRDQFYDGDRILITQYRNSQSTEANYVRGTDNDWTPGNVANQLYVQPETTYKGKYPVAYDGILPDQSPAGNFLQSNLLETPVVTPTDQWLEFTGENAFKHANSRVTLILDLQQPTSSTPALRISGEGLHSGGSASETVTFFRAADKQYTAIVAPGISGTLSVTLTLDGISYPVSLNCARTANTHYTYTLAVKNGILVPLSEEIKSWGNGETVNGDLTDKTNE